MFTAASASGSRTRSEPSAVASHSPIRGAVNRACRIFASSDTWSARRPAALGGMYVCSSQCRADEIDPSRAISRSSDTNSPYAFVASAMPALDTPDGRPSSRGRRPGARPGAPTTRRNFLAPAVRPLSQIRCGVYHLTPPSHPGTATGATRRRARRFPRSELSMADNPNVDLDQPTQAEQADQASPPDQPSGGASGGAPGAPGSTGSKDLYKEKFRPADTALDQEVDAALAGVSMDDLYKFDKPRPDAPAADAPPGAGGAAPAVGGVAHGYKGPRRG